MNLADRGGASGFVGTAWGQQCNTWLSDHTGAPIMWGGGNLGTIRRVIDVDALPGMAAFASARALQNPDYLLEIETDDGMCLVGADAKFSVETAKPRQVSTEIISALVDTPGSPLASLVPAFESAIDGFFLSPDFELTDLVLEGRGGIQRVSIDASDVVRIRPDIAAMFDRPDISQAMDVLARIDQQPNAWTTSLTIALYYARIAFGCLGCHTDERKPLLGRWDPESHLDSGLSSAIEARARRASSAWNLLLRWDRDAEQIRETRLRVHGASDIGVMNRDLRNMIEAESKRLSITPPSLNKIRRALSIWALGELDKTIGVVTWPVDDLEAVIQRIETDVRRLRPQVPEQVRRLVSESNSDS